MPPENPKVKHSTMAHVYRTPVHRNIPYIERSTAPLQVALHQRKSRDGFFVHGNGSAEWPWGPAGSASAQHSVHSLSNGEATDRSLALAAPASRASLTPLRKA